MRVSFSIVFIILAVVLFLIAGLLSAGTISTDDPTTVNTLVAFGLGSFAAGHLPV
ncbi:MAG: hypothetical protein ABIP06_13490 [Pyrinomonadaceae bacterium]